MINWTPVKFSSEDTEEYPQTGRRSLQSMYLMNFYPEYIWSRTSVFRLHKELSEHSEKLTVLFLKIKIFGHFLKYCQPNISKDAQHH